MSNLHEIISTQWDLAPEEDWSSESLLCNHPAQRTVSRDEHTEPFWPLEGQDDTEVEFQEFPTEFYIPLLQAFSEAMKLQRECFMRFVGPSFSAIMAEEEEVSFRTIFDKFDTLSRSWKDYNLGRSRIEYNHFAHYQIIGMGMSIVPLLLERMEQGDNDWIMALKAITGAAPDKEVSLGDAKSVRRVWANWAIDNGYTVFTGPALAYEAIPDDQMDDNRPQRGRLE